MGGSTYMEHNGIRIVDPDTFEPISSNSKRGRVLMNKTLDTYKNTGLLMMDRSFGVDFNEKREEEKEDPIDYNYYFDCETGLKKRVKFPSSSTQTPHVNQLIEIERIGRTSTIISEKVDHNIQEIEVKKEPVKSKWRWGKKKD